MNELRKIFKSQNNKKDYEVRYGRDFGENLTVGGFVDGLEDLLRCGGSDEDFCGYINKYFLFGCWKYETEDRDPLFLRDVRGIIVECLKRGINEKTK